MKVTTTWRIKVRLSAIAFTISVLSLTYGAIIDSYTEKFRETSEWITSTFYIGAMIVVPVIGYLGNAFARKKILFASSAALSLLLLVNPRFGLLKTQPDFIPVFGWQNVLVEYLNLVKYLNFVPILLHASACTIVLVYIGETASDHARGLMGSYFHFFVCSGHVLYTVFGLYLIESVGIALLVPLALFNLISLIVLFFLPETPTYYVLNNRTDDAIKALTRLRENNEELALNEFQELSSSVCNETSEKKENFSALKSVVDYETIKALLIGCVLIVVRQGSCADRIAFLYKEKLHDDYLKMAVDLLPVVGAIIAITLIERFGRKPLLLISSTGMAISIVTQHICNDTLLMPEYQRQLLLETAYAIYIFSFHLGFGPVPWVLLSEIFKPKAKIPAIALCVFINSQFHALINFYAQPRFLDLLEISILALNCEVGAIFTYFFVPETKGKSVGYILTELEYKKKIEKPSKLSFDPHVKV